MHTSAEDAFLPEMKRLEGYTTWLYFDTHRPPLATTGVGNMIDSGAGLTAFGRSLPWRTKVGEYATEAAIQDEYDRLKKLGIQAQGGYAYRSHAGLFLDEPVIDWAFDRTAAAMEAVVAQTLLGAWDAMRPDAQLAVMSMAWNMGPRFFASWPNLTRALRTGDYLAASDNCEINGTPSERNRRNRILFTHAALAVASNTSLEQLLGPTATVQTSVITSAKSGTFSGQAFLVQAMLRAAGTYTSRVDGLYGPVSKAAYATWERGAKQPTSPTTAGLTTLSRATLHLTITD